AVQAAPQNIVVAEHKNVALDVLMLMRFENRTIEIYEPDASFLKLHFSRFNIPEGVTVEVRSPDGRESYRYTRGGNEARTMSRKAGDDGGSAFSAMSISGDTAIVEVLGNIGQIKSLKNRVYIDYYMAGYPEDSLGAAGSGKIATANSKLEVSGTQAPKPQSICGIDERIPAACWEQSDPTEFDRSWPVARLLINGSKSCTAWRVGPENFLFTNNHCVATQEELETVEVWFNYQAVECNSYTLEETVKVPANTLFATHQELDFTLFSVQDFPSIEPFGYLGLDVRDAQLGERIYIPQHGFGSPKQIAIESDMNASGLCEVDNLHVDRYAPDTDIGYFCDSAGGSSGSPVLAGSSGRAIALHHFGGCVNSGVKMSLIWPEVSGFFGGKAPGGDDETTGDENLPPVAQFDYACDETACSFNAGASTDTDGTISEYTWSFGDGATDSGMTAAHAYAEARRYRVLLTVVDDKGLSASQAQTVTIEPANQPPVAAFQVSCDGLACTFDGAASSDADGSVASYNWAFGDGTGGTFGVSSVSHTYTSAGQYAVQLLVTDDDGATATADTLLTVSEPVLENQSPQASFAVSCQNLACDFDAGGSADADGTIVSYSWEFGDGTGETAGVSAIGHTYLAAGQYTVVLRVTDNASATATADTLLTVSEPENQVPQASFTFSCQELACDFDASASADPDGAIRSYRWEFGDGATGGGERVSHAFGADGVYDVRLTVSDDREASSAVTRAVQVTKMVARVISLSAATGKYRGDTWIDLEWSGAMGSTVDLYRDGSLLAITGNDGFYRDATFEKRDKSIRYRLCEQGTDICSDEVVVLR
ncbi:MAG: PKD domain-containing protein, partial [Planctomycetes bacterium]|nr:PKD domain-containing protein [Planctomycetota bacterium]